MELKVPVFQYSIAYVPYELILNGIESLYGQTFSCNMLKGLILNGIER